MDGIIISKALGQQPCPICGRAFSQRKGAGRPRDYCNKNCRRLKAALVDVALMLDGRIDFVDDTRIRADLWTLANTLNPEVME